MAYTAMPALVRDIYKMAYIPNHFTLKECLPSHLYQAWKHAGASAWQVFDERILKAADWLRRLYGPMSVNVGNLQQCGFRDNIKPESRSQHRFGRALDLHPSEVSVQEIRRNLTSDPAGTYNKGIHFLETDISWLHIDCRDNSELQVWSPKRGFVRYLQGEAVNV